MITKPLGTAKYIPQRQIEDESITILRDVLLGKVDISKIWAGNDANYDGRFELINQIREYTGLKFDVQIKALNKRNIKSPSLSCKRKFLRHCELSNVPVFLFGIDTKNKIVYWEHLSKGYLKNLKIKKKQKTKVIQFNKTNLIKKDDSSTEFYWGAWEAICKRNIDTNDVEQQMELLKESVETNHYVENSVNRMLYKLGKSINGKTYDEIINDFSFLDGLIYFKTKEEYPIVDFVINLYNRFSNYFGNQVVYKTSFRDIPGKSREDMLIKYSDLLQKVRYIKIKEVFSILTALFLKEKNKEVKERLKKIIEEFSGYNLYVLQKIGYYPQKEILKVIENWTMQEKLKNIEVIILIAYEILKPSFEGRSLTDYKTLTLTSGALNPNKELKKIRRRTIKLLWNICVSTSKLKEKILILEAMSQASHQPSGQYGDDVAVMIIGDIKYLTSLYQTLVDAKVDAPILQEVERQLCWFKRFSKGKILRHKKIIDSLRDDKFYSLYRLFVGKEFEYTDDEKDFSTIEKEINDKINEVLNSISLTNSQQYFKNFEKIAKFFDEEKEWEFQKFKDFLEKLAYSKPDVAIGLLPYITNKNKAISLFLGNFLRGLRLGNHRKLLDSSLKIISERANASLLKSIPISIIGMEKKFLSEIDVMLVCEIANHLGKFNHISKIKNETQLRILHCLTMRSLMWASVADSKTVKGSIVRMIKRDKKLTKYYLSELAIAILGKRISFKEWSGKDIKLIIDKLIEDETFDYHLQNIFSDLVDNKLDKIIDFFVARIKFRKRFGKKAYLSNYKAIPHNLNADLIKKMKNHPDYKNAIRRLFKELKDDKSKGIYGWQIAELFEELTKFDDVLKDLLLEKARNGTKEDFIAILRILSHFNGGFDVLTICLEIVKNNQEKEIWNECISVISRTGAVVGENGLSGIFRNRLEESKSFTLKNKFQKKFMKKLQDHFKESINRHAEQEQRMIEEMKKDFEMESV